MPISDWHDLMPQTIEHRAATGTDAYGKPTYSGATTTYKARIVEKPRRVISRITGDDVLASTRVWVGGIIEDLSINDEITLPDGRKPIILTWELYPDEAGDHHMVLSLQHK